MVFTVSARTSQYLAEDTSRQPESVRSFRQQQLTCPSIRSQTFSTSSGLCCYRDRFHATRYTEGCTPVTFVADGLGGRHGPTKADFHFEQAPSASVPRAAIQAMYVEAGLLDEVHVVPRTHAPRGRRSNSTRCRVRTRRPARATRVINGTGVARLTFRVVDEESSGCREEAQPDLLNPSHSTQRPSCPLARITGWRNQPAKMRHRPRADLAWPRGHGSPADAPAPRPGLSGHYRFLKSRK